MIAVSCTLRRLAAKVGGNKVMKEMGDLLAPRQLGFDVKGGAEAAVHAVRLYLQDPTLNPSKAVLKLDFKNAFNTIHRDWMLNAIGEHCPTPLSIQRTHHHHPFFGWTEPYNRQRECSRAIP